MILQERKREGETMTFGFRARYVNDDFVFEDKSTGELIPAEDVVKRIYDYNERDKPYDEKTYQADWMAFVSLCLAAVVSYKVYCAQTLATENFVPSLSRTFMNSDEALHHLTCYPPVARLPDAWLIVLVEGYSHIRGREVVTIKKIKTIAAGTAGNDIPRVMRLKQVLGLSHFSYFALWCAIICNINRGFERACKVLQGNDAVRVPTLGIIQTLYNLVFENESKKGEKRAENWLLEVDSLENSLLFNFVSDYTLMRPVTLRPVAFSHIMGMHYSSRELLSCVVKLEPIKRTPLHLDSQLNEARVIYKSMASRGESRLCVLSGARGSGKKLTLQWLASVEGVTFILVDLDKLLLDKTHFSAILEELLFLALVEGRLICFCSTRSVSQMVGVADRLKGYNLGIFFLSESKRRGTTPNEFVTQYIDYPPLDLEVSPAFWETFASEYEFSLDINWVQIAARYSLSAGQIESAVRSAAEMAKSQNSLATEDIVSAVVLLEHTGRLGAIADRIDLVYTWDDLMLDELPKKMLRDACNRVKFRYTVEIEWGGRSAYGNGISILLYGPPGTGKTMSAQVVARELGLPLYRVNLAHIISKYIGETAKNINAVFEEAKNSNVILFFDEADALFAKRTDVKNSNDRHANSESSYLLQKIEDYSGISILATNLAHAFDEAFRRRINYMINIHMPKADQRLAIWTRCIPTNAPLADDVDLKLLANSLEFSGSVIRSAALQAAYFAAGDGSAIGMSHLVRAVRLELQKLGMNEPHFLSVVN